VLACAGRRHGDCRDHRAAHCVRSHDDRADHSDSCDDSDAGAYDDGNCNPDGDSDDNDHVAAHCLAAEVAGANV
jgi:hypothetical protein